jgi:hypothetical protein
MKRKICISTAIVCFFAFMSNAQNSKYELGLNIVNVLTTAFNVDAKNEITDPFTFFLKLRHPKKYSRFGGFIYLRKNEEFIDLNELLITETRIGVKYGQEKRKPLIKNLQLCYGLDIQEIFESRNAKVNQNSPFGKFTITTEDRNINTGLSCFVGLNYHFGEYVYLSIESNLIGQINFVNSIKKNTGVDDENTSAINWSLKHNLPQSLYIYIKF